MGRSRLEAFSDAVIAILITIMVLELKVPHETDLHGLMSLWPVFLAYVLSFVYLAIYWNNHHHMFHLVDRVNGGILWANNHLLFWLSLVPFATAWTGESGFAPLPTFIYSAVMLMAAIAYFILSHAIMQDQGRESKLRQAFGRDWKGIASPAIYVLAMILSPFLPIGAFGLLVLVAIIWIVPDRRVERLRGKS